MSFSIIVNIWTVIILCVLYVEILTVEIHVNVYHCKSEMLKLMIVNCLFYVWRILEFLGGSYWPRTIILDHMLAWSLITHSVFQYQFPVKTEEQSNRRNNMLCSKGKFYGPLSILPVLTHVLLQIYTQIKCASLTDLSA